MVVTRSLAVAAVAAACALANLHTVEGADRFGWFFHSWWTMYASHFLTPRPPSLVSTVCILAVKACGECSSTTVCVVEDTGTRLAAGTTQLALRLCNYNAAAAPELELRLKTPLACDPRGALVPKLKTLAPSGGTACPATGECAVVAELERAIDWAVAMRTNSGELNAVLATFTRGGSAEVVTVAQSDEINGAAMPATASTVNVSVCASAVEVKALRLSQLDGCSTADICRGKATDTACVVPVRQGLPITGVTCDKDACTGTLALGGSFGCDAAQGDTTALIVAVKAGAGALSNYASIGTLIAPTPVITDVSDLEVGSASFTLATDSFCSPSAVQVTVASGATPAAVASVNTTNGSIAVTLSAPIEASLDDSKLAITLTQCSVASTPFESLVGDDDDSSDAGVGSSSSRNSSSGQVNSTSGVNWTQETNVDSGLSGGLYVGIAVAVVAVFGFVFEHWFHKRRQAQPPRSTTDAPVTSNYAHSGSL